MSVQAYPLQWPAGWPRTPPEKRERSGYAYKAWRAEVKHQLGHGMRSALTAERAGQIDAFGTQESTDA